MITLTHRAGKACFYLPSKLPENDYINFLPTITIKSYRIYAVQCTQTSSFRIGEAYFDDGRADPLPFVAVFSSIFDDRDDFTFRASKIGFLF